MEESSPSRLSLGTIFYSDVELRDQTPPYWASRSTNWRVLAGIRLTLAAAWDETHKLAARVDTLVLGKRKQSRARRTVDDSSRAAASVCCPEPARLLLLSLRRRPHDPESCTTQERIDGSDANAAPTSTVLATESAARAAAALS